MDRLQVRAVALQVAAFIETLIAKIKAGPLDFRFVFWLAQQLPLIAPAITSVTGTRELRAMFLGEVVDAYTGDDPTALHFLDEDMLKGLAPGDVESFFDGLKPLLEALYLKADALPLLDTEPQPPPGPPTR